MRRVLSRAAAALAVITGVTLGASSIAAEAAPAPRSTTVKTVPVTPAPVEAGGGTYSQQDWWW